MFKETVLSHSLRLMFAGSLALGMQVAHAQDVQRVEVTGSSIKRIAAESSLPVQTFSQKDIQKTGVTSVTDFIQQLPAMQGFTAASDSVGGGGGGITTASIHDVGASYTLVLLNGRRIAPATSGTTIDLNSIPLAAVERIEVLTDGASALYGADAIAGVVNFILKKGQSPVEITAKMTRPQHSGGGGFNLSISKGFGDYEKDGFNLYLAAAHDENKQLKASERDFAKTGIINFNDPKTGKPLQFFNGSSRSVPPNITIGYKDVAGKNQRVNINPYLIANKKCAPAHVDLGDGQCYFDYTSAVEIFPEQKRDAFYATGSVKLGDTGFKGFADFAYTDAHIIARIAPYPAEFALAKNSPLFTKYVAPNLTAEQLNGLTSTTVKYRLYDIGGRAYDYGTKATHLVTGIDGTAFGWDLNSAVTYSENKQTTDYVGGFPLAAKFDAAIAAGQIDPFPYTVGQMPADQLAALNATQFKGLYSTQTIKMTAFDVRGSRELFKLSGGTAQLGLGFDYRDTKFTTEYSSTAKNADILFDDPQLNNGYRRSTKGAFAELVMPITKELEVTGSLRYDSIGGVENATTKTTFGTTKSAATYKVSGKFTPMKNLLFRGAIGTGFKAASMSEIARPVEDFGVTGGTYACPFSAANGLDTHPLAQYCSGRNQYEAFKGGNKDLKPEKSKQWSLGFVFEPTNNMSLGLDLWNVQISDAVQEVDEALYFKFPNRYLSLFTTKTKASTGVPALAIIQSPINLGKVENRGIDYDLMFRTNVYDGKLTTRLSGTHLLKSRYTTPGDNTTWETSLDRYGANAAVSFRNVFKINATYEKGAWNHSLTMNYRNGYEDKHHEIANCAVNTNDAAQDCVDVKLNVPDYYTFDWQTKYAVMKNLDLTFGIVNVADKKPPLSLRNTGSHQLGYDPRYASPVGRAFYLNGSYKF